VIAVRRFDTGNKGAPAIVDRMASKVPACFDARMWRLWLQEFWRSVLNAPDQRRAFERGQVPDYCAECTREHRAARLAQGRCHPPAGAEPHKECE
jgi:hypothetical protein